VRCQRGTALVEIILLGFAIVALAIPTVVSASALAAAKGEAQTAAIDAAAWYARHGSLPDRSDDGVDLTVVAGRDDIVVHAVVEVTVLGIGGGGVTLSLDGTARAPVSPYRSNR
jgi:uncharacterized lipoprotein YbaY